MPKNYYFENNKNTFNIIVDGVLCEAEEEVGIKLDIPFGESFVMPDVAAPMGKFVISPLSRGTDRYAIIDYELRYKPDFISVQTETWTEEVEECETIRIPAVYEYETTSTLISSGHYVWETDDDNGKMYQVWVAPVYDTERIKTLVTPATTEEVCKTVTKTRSRTVETPATFDSIIAIKNDVEQGSISCVASYANRVFYSGIKSDIITPQAYSPSVTGMVFFSKLVEKEADLGVCHMTADPTNEYDNALLPTDGGYIKLTGSGNVRKMIDFSGMLICFAENGIWAISGGQEQHFTADAHIVERLSSLAVTSPDSVLSTEFGIFFWNESGIYVLDKTGQVQSLTAETIQRVYMAIPAASKSKVKGVYDKASLQLRWLYADYTGYDPSSFANKYNKELVFSIKTKSFTVLEFSVEEATYPFLFGYMETPPYTFTTSEDIITAEGIPVTAAAVVVSHQIRVPSATAQERRYLAMWNAAGAYNWTYALANDVALKDWRDIVTAGVPYDSYVVTQELNFDDIFRQKMVPFLHTHFQQTEKSTTIDGVSGELVFDFPSSCTVTPMWDFANSNAGSKYGSSFEAYRLNNFTIPEVDKPFDYGSDVIYTKTRLRGKGMSVRFKFEATSGKDMQMLAWGFPVNAA